MRSLRSDFDVDAHYDLIKVKLILMLMLMLMFITILLLKVMWRTFESRLLSRLGRLTRAHTNQVIIQTSCREKNPKTAKDKETKNSENIYKRV